MNAPIPPVRRNDRYLEITKDRENFSSLEQATQDRLREAAAGNLRVKLADKTPTAKLDQDTATYIDTGTHVFSSLVSSNSLLNFSNHSQQKAFTVSLSSG